MFLCVISRKKDLQKQLYKVQDFLHPKLALEQYMTPAEIAAEIVWSAYMLDDIQDKTILDAGAGTGMLGIAALLLGAKHVHFVETDDNALAQLKDHLELFKIGSESYTLHHTKIQGLDITSLQEQKIDTAIQNPPFGTKDAHADKAFLEVLSTLADTIYSTHKISTAAFTTAFAKDHKYTITHKWPQRFPLKQQFDFHTKKREFTQVQVLRFSRNTV